MLTNPFKKPIKVKQETVYLAESTDARYKVIVIREGTDFQIRYYEDNTPKAFGIAFPDSIKEKINELIDTSKKDNIEYSIKLNKLGA